MSRITAEKTTLAGKAIIRITNPGQERVNSLRQKAAEKKTFTNLEIAELLLIVIEKLEHALTKG